MPQYQFVLIFQSCRKDTTVTLLFPGSCGDGGEGKLILRVPVFFSWEAAESYTDAYFLTSFTNVSLFFT